MSHKSVFSIATTRAQAGSVVERLKAASFSNEAISVLFPESATSQEFAREKSTRVPVGTAAGGITDGLIGLGMPAAEAKHFDEKVQEGNLLVSVQTENADEIARATEVFTRGGAGADDICAADEAAAPATNDAVSPDVMREPVASSVRYIPGPA